MDTYTVNGERIATTLEGAAEWAKAHFNEWADCNIMLVMGGDDDTDAINVDSDVLNIIETQKEDAKPEVQVLSEALAQLTAAFTRHTFEASAEIEALKKRVSFLEEK